MSNRIVLKNKDDFRWYKKGLDLKGRYEHDHNGEPEKYPCAVISHWYDDPNGPYTYNHEFYYKKTESATCSKCGHVTTKTFWPEIN